QHAPRDRGEAPRARRDQDADLAQLLSRGRVLADLQPAQLRRGEAPDRPEQRVSGPLREDLSGRDGRALACGMRWLAVLAIAACSSSGPPEPEPGCNPLIGDDCMTPYPSSFYQSATGQVAIPDGVLPTPKNTTLATDRLNSHDGFSPSTPFVVYFKDGV